MLSEGIKKVFIEVTGMGVRVTIEGDQKILRDGV